MRYDTTMDDLSSAHDIINKSTEFDLIEIFKKFGEEKYSESISKLICTER